jgi:RNA polymerase sigma factor (sigma-70 family)
MKIRRRKAMKATFKFVTGEIVEVEVDQELGKAMIEMERVEYNANRKETRRHTSLSALEENGCQFPDTTIDIHSFIEDREAGEILHKTLQQLLPRQRELIRKVFFENRSVASIAATEGVSEAAIRCRLRKIYRKLKKLTC